MDLDGHTATFRFLIRDRAGQFTTPLDACRVPELGHGADLRF
jgi:hypothetical protein